MIRESNVLILGLSFKENCSDIRNTKVLDIIKRFSEYRINVEVVDPWVYPEDAKEEYGIDVLKEIPSHRTYTVIIVAVAHNQFKAITIKEWENMLNKDSILFDLKGILPREINSLRL